MLVRSGRDLWGESFLPPAINSVGAVFERSFTGGVKEASPMSKTRKKRKRQNAFSLSRTAWMCDDLVGDRMVSLAAHERLKLSLNDHGIDS